MKRAFITGSTGFLGLNIVKKLCEAGWEVTALYLPGEKLKYLSEYKVNMVEGNILDYENLVKLMPENLDAIFHVAGDISMWKKNDERQYRVNVLGTSNMCKAAIEKQAHRFIHTSSSSAFGYHPYKLDELTPSNAMECGMSYNKTKYLAEQVVKRAVDYGLYAVILNPCNIIGPYDPGNWSQVIKNVVDNKLNGYPTGMGTFSHVSDIADAHISAVENGSPGENYLLGGVEATFQEVIEEISNIAGLKKNFKEISARKLKLLMNLSYLKSMIDGNEPAITLPKYLRLTGILTCDDTRAKDSLNFSTCSISEMLNDSYKWMKKENIM